MSSNPVGWFEIYVQDLPRAAAFYESVLGVKLSKLEGAPVDMLAFPGNRETYGAPGALVRMEGFSSGGNGVIVYFSCADCAVEAARVVKAGGAIVKPKFPIGRYGFIALATDTEGNVFGLHSCA